MTGWTNFIVIFNDREKALGIWLVISLIAIFSMKSIRPAIMQLIKAFFVLWIPILLTLSYISLVVMFFYKLHFWDTSLIKDTVFWLLGSAFVLFFGINKAQGATEAKKYFQDIFKEAFKISIILEFIVSFYTFGFWIEFFLIPIIFLIATFNAIAESKTEPKSIRKSFNAILGLVGLAYIVFSIVNLFINYSPFLQLSNLRSFVLPLLLTIMYVPFLYLLALFMNYQSFFVRLNILYRDEMALATDIKKATLRRCNLRLILLNQFIGYFYANRVRIKESRDLKCFFDSFQRSQTKVGETTSEGSPLRS